MASREDIFAALFALSDGLVWGAPPRGLAHRSRRLALWSDVPAQPALCQAEHDEDLSEVTGLRPVRTYSASGPIYHDLGKDPDAVPARETNLILDAVETLFRTDDPDAVQTLGGLVHHCFISGSVFKDPGDLDGQGLIIVVPIDFSRPERRATPTFQLKEAAMADDPTPVASTDASDKPDLEQRILAAIRGWRDEFIANGPIARASECWNHLEGALAHLAASILKEI